jgi:hypothetical protein
MRRSKKRYIIRARCADGTVYMGKTRYIRIWEYSRRWCKPMRLTEALDLRDRVRAYEADRPADVDTAMYNIRVVEF